MIVRMVLLPFALVRSLVGLVVGMLRLGLGVVIGILRLLFSHTLGALVGGIIGFALGCKHVGLKWGWPKK